MISEFDLVDVSIPLGTSPGKAAPAESERIPHAATADTSAQSVEPRRAASALARQGRVSKFPRSLIVGLTVVSRFTTSQPQPELANERGKMLVRYVFD